jgi:uncharacterized membrane protein YbhN (UPF0104 family)
MGRVLALLRSRWVRYAFVVVALGAAVYAVQREWDDIVPALRQMPVGLVVASFGVGVVYLLLTMMSWRAVLTDLGSRLPGPAAFGVFFVSQLGKYVPGGVWNVVAASELGADHRIPRRRSLSAMLVTVFVSVVSGLAVGVPALALTAGGLQGAYRWLWVLLPVTLALLAPPVMNRVLARVMRLARREPLEHPLTTAGTLQAVGWAVASWFVAGFQVWLLALGTGVEASPASWARVSGAYAVAWVVGFLVLVVPAGLGAREVVLLALLAPLVPNDGAVLVLVLVSRIVQTVADLALAGTGLAVARRATRASRAAGTAPGDRPAD